MYASSNYNTYAFASLQSELLAFICMLVCLGALLHSKKNNLSHQAVTSLMAAGQNAETHTSPSAKLLNPNDSMGMQLKLHTNPKTRKIEINYYLFHDAGVELSIYDIGGKQIDILFKAHRHKGVHKHTWHNSQLAKGMYFVRLHSPGRQLVKKVLIP